MKSVNLVVTLLGAAVADESCSKDVFEAEESMIQIKQTKLSGACLGGPCNQETDSDSGSFVEQ
eukprot:gene1005-122_t